MNNLLTPRFKVIGSFPDSPFHEKEILDAVKYEENKFYLVRKNKKNYWVSQFPNIFRKLEWWENRTEEEMPKYLKSGMGNDNQIHKIEYWDMSFDKPIGVVKDLGYKKSVCDLGLFKNEYQYQPSTEAEYTDYMNSL